jgi:glycosyltransferase involved in cell wall biosynthesis
MGINIVHYFLGLPPLHSGGLQRYVTDLAISQKRDCDYDNIYLLFPGEINFLTNKSLIKYYKKYKGIKQFRIINPAPFSFNGIKNVASILKSKKNNYKYFFVKYRINILHVHSLMGISKELLCSAKELGVKIIFSTHDYYGLCPTINLFNYKNEQCSDYRDGLECFKCNFYATESKYLYIRTFQVLFPKIYSFLIGLYKRTNIKKVRSKHKNFSGYNIEADFRYKYFRDYYRDLFKYFDFIIFNSEITKEVYSKYIDLKDKNYTIIPVSHNNISDCRKINKYNINKDCVNLLYMGVIDHKKGFFDLIKVLETLKNEYRNWKLHIYADYSHIDISNYDKNFYIFNGPYNHNNISKIFEDKNLLIVPSKWKETFGFIALEAYSYGIPSLLSENVGFSGFVKDRFDTLIYGEHDKDNKLIDLLREILNDSKILEEVHKNIIKNENYYGFLMEYHLILLNKIYYVGLKEK